MHIIYFHLQNLPIFCNKAVFIFFINFNDDEEEQGTTILNLILLGFKCFYFAINVL